MDENTKKLLRKIGSVDMSKIPDGKSEYEQYIDDLAALDEDDFNNWEQEFLYDMEIRIRHKQGMTLNQRKKLKELWIKYCS